MARKTFISYKFSESQEARDMIIDALGEDAQYYQGETSDSPNMNDLKTDSIKKNLSDMIYGTSVTIVIISPNMKASDWIEWEVNYSIRKSTRDGRQSQPNKLLVVYHEGYENTWRQYAHTVIVDNVSKAVSLTSMCFFPQMIIESLFRTIL